jgi:hypothetical protein
MFIVVSYANAEDYIVDGEDARSGEIKWQVCTVVRTFCKIR